MTNDEATGADETTEENRPDWQDMLDNEREWEREQMTGGGW